MPKRRGKFQRRLVHGWDLGRTFVSYNGIHHHEFTALGGVIKYYRENFYCTIYDEGVTRIKCDL